MNYSDDLNSLRALAAEIKMKSSRRFASDAASIDFDNLVSVFESLARKHADDKDFMIEASTIDPDAVREASSALKSDPEFVKAIMEKSPNVEWQNYGVDKNVIDQIKNGVTQEQQPIEVVPEEVQPEEVVQAEAAPAQTAEKHGMHGTRYQQQTIMADAIADMHQYVKDHPDEFLQEPSKRGINMPDPVQPAPVEQEVQAETVQEEQEVELPKEKVDEVMQAYSNSGYGQNAYGEYFDPNQDEYDPNYDPHNDPLFNSKIDPTNGLGGKDHNQLYGEYADICNKMAEILGVEPFAGIENANLFNIAYQLDDNDRDRFNELKDQLRVVNDLDSTISKEYADDITFINSARTQMGAMLNMNPYPGIEREDFNRIDFQLDDNEKDRFFELQEQLEQLKKKHPELFRNTQITKGVAPVSQAQEETQEVTQEEKQEAAQEVVQEAPIDDNPQHQANPENGYAVGGFQAPAIIVGNGAATDGDQGDDSNNSSDDSAQSDDEELTDDRGPEVVDNVDDPDLEQDQLDPEGLTDEEMQIMIRQQKRKEFTKKALAASVGFVAGVGLSCVPGVGQIRMAIAATKLVAAGVNFWAKRHPDGKIAKMRNFVVNQWYDKCPNFARGYDKIKAKLKTVPYNAFINGMSAGYITGNVFEMLTGNTVLEAIGDKMHPTPTVSEIPQATPTEPQIEAAAPDQITGPVDSTPVPDATPVPDTVPTGPTTEQITDAIKHGEHIDISGIEMGRVSSDAQNAVKLLQSAGKDVTFLREVTLPDGTVMWAFNQSNGAGYAWFKADEILDYLGQNAPEIASSMSR